MGKIIYVTGGARSGKSSFAEACAKKYESVLYIATAQAFDQEMEARIAHHRQSRPAHWRTKEGFEDLDLFIKDEKCCALLDCLTIQITNLMMKMQVDWDKPTVAEAEAAEKIIAQQVDKLLVAAKQEEIDLIVVSNELGMGLVPAFAFGRIFRDIAGRMNQKVARAADEAHFLVSGMPIRLK